MNLLAVFTVSLLLLAAAGTLLAGWLYSDRHFRLLFLWIPLCLLAAGGTYKTVTSVMGWPSSDLPADFAMLSYKTDGKQIYIWGVEKGLKTPRTWVQPYDKNLHEQLEEAKKDRQKGGGQGLRKQGKPGDGTEDSHGTWQKYDLQKAQPLPPKELQ